MSGKSLRTVCDKRFLDARRRRCVLGAAAGEKSNAPDACVNGAFNVETVERKVARLASDVRQSCGPNIGGAVYTATPPLSGARCFLARCQDLFVGGCSYLFPSLSFSSSSVTFSTSCSSVTDVDASPRQRPPRTPFSSVGLPSSRPRSPRPTVVPETSKPHRAQRRLPSPHRTPSRRP